MGALRFASWYRPEARRMHTSSPRRRRKPIAKDVPAQHALCRMAHLAASAKAWRRRRALVPSRHLGKFHSIRSCFRLGGGTGLRPHGVEGRSQSRTVGASRISRKRRVNCTPMTAMPPRPALRIASARHCRSSRWWLQPPTAPCRRSPPGPPSHARALPLPARDHLMRETEAINGPGDDGDGDGSGDLV